MRELERQAEVLEQNKFYLQDALKNYNTNGVQSTKEAVIIANEWMLGRFYQVGRDVQIKFLNDIFYSLLPYCKEQKDFQAVELITNKLLNTIKK